MKILTFGCSLTQICGIPDFFKKNFEVIDFSMSAGSNQLQIQRFYDDAIKLIKNDDIICWQITSIDRPWARMSKYEFNELKQKIVPELPDGHSCFVENEKSIDLLCNANYNSITPIYFDIHKILNFLSFLNSNYKLFVWIGHEGFITPHQNLVEKFFKDKNISYTIDYFTKWCWNRHLKFMDEVHPDPSSGFLYAELCLFPLLKKLIEFGDKDANV